MSPWTAKPTISSDFERTSANKKAFLDQQGRPMKAVYQVWKPNGKPQKKPALRVRSFKLTTTYY
jgi:hypothetical protein